MAVKKLTAPRALKASSSNHSKPHLVAAKPRRIGKAALLFKPSHKPYKPIGRSTPWVDEILSPGEMEFASAPVSDRIHLLFYRLHAELLRDLALLEPRHIGAVRSRLRKEMEQAVAELLPFGHPSYDQQRREFAEERSTRYEDQLALLKPARIAPLRAALIADVKHVEYLLDALARRIAQEKDLIPAKEFALMKPTDERRVPIFIHDPKGLFSNAAILIDELCGLTDSPSRGSIHTAYGAASRVAEALMGDELMNFPLPEPKKRGARKGAAK
jgi:hypothetical protein